MSEPKTRVCATCLGRPRPSPCPSCYGTGLALLHGQRRPHIACLASLRYGDLRIIGIVQQILLERKTGDILAVTLAGPTDDNVGVYERPAMPPARALYGAQRCHIALAKREADAERSLWTVPTAALAAIRPFYSRVWSLIRDAGC